MKKIITGIKKYLPSGNVNDFIKHNKMLWKNESEVLNTSNEILVEYTGMHSALIAYSYLANILKNRYQAEIYAYSNNSIGRLKNFFLGKIFTPIQDIFRSFNVSKFIYVQLTSSQKKEVSRLYDSCYSKLDSKLDVERLTIEGAVIGDLIYDSYLRREKKPTIVLDDIKFKETLKHSLTIYVFWKNYLSKHSVKAILISHCVYDLAILLRIAISKQIPVYQINATHLYKMDEENQFAYVDFKYFPEYYSKLPNAIKVEGIKRAKERLQRRFSGEVGVDMEYSTKSAYTNNFGKKVLRDSEKTKILIATHCFFDSPHPYGNNLFPDFYEWLHFLGDISERTDYDWYIKTHPDFLPGNTEIIQEFISQYPKFTLIPSETSHIQIINEGINLALTVYGTIGFEYAALGVPVINASLNNPHVGYDFNIHPENITAYRNLLLNLDSIDIKINKDDIYEFYFIKHLFNTNNWLFNDYQEMLEAVGGYRNQFTPAVYKIWINEFSISKHQNLIATINNFIDSNDFRLQPSHFVH